MKQQFVRQFSTYPREQPERVATQITDVLNSDPTARVVEIFWLPIHKIGGYDIEAIVVFEHDVSSPTGKERRRGRSANNT